ncbi:MAG: leucine-rich repeat domain-containing protein [Gammaproteobacteria bacterium]
MLHNQISESKRHKNLHDKLAEELKGIISDKDIQKIILNSNSLKNEDILALIEVAKTLPSLKEIDLSNNELGGEPNWILPLLVDLPIMRLILKNNPIYFKDAEKIVDRAIKAGKKFELDIQIYDAEKTVDRAIKAGNQPEQDITFRYQRMDMAGFQKLKTKSQKTNLSIHDPKVPVGDDVLERKDQEITGEALRRVIKRLQSTPIKSLKLTRCKLGDAEVKALADAIMTTQMYYLEELDLSENKMSCASSDKICDLLKTCRVLRRVNLYKNQLEDKGISQLAQGISSASSLQYLNVAENQIGVMGVAAISGAIKERPGFEAIGLPGDLIVADQDLSKDKINMLLAQLNKFPIRKLKLINCKIGDAEIKSLVQAIEKSQLPYLEKLDFSKNAITDAGLQALAQLAPKCLKLRSVLLGGNHLSLEDEHAASNLDLMKNLSRLDLSSNAIADLGAQVVFDKLLSSKSLQTLDLRNNKLSPELMIRFILKSGDKKIGLAKNLPMRCLNCSNLGLSDAEMAKILRVLVDEVLYGELEKIDFSGNQITDHGFNIVSSFATRCPRLTVLDLKRNLISFENVGEAKRDCFYHVRELDLASNKIVEKGGLALADKIQKSTSLKLKKLFLNENKISYVALQAIEKAVASKTTLDKVDLSGNEKIVVSESDNPDVSITRAPSLFRRDRQSPVQFFELVENHFVSSLT